MYLRDVFFFLKNVKLKMIYRNSLVGNKVFEVLLDELLGLLRGEL